MPFHKVPSLPARIQGEFEVVECRRSDGQEIWLLREATTGLIYSLKPRIVQMELRTGVMFSGFSPPLHIYLR